MTEQSRHRGILSPVVTPFDAKLRPDISRLSAQCRWLLSNDVGLALFGTNSEATSLGLNERIEILEGLVDAGIPVSRMMPGTGTCSITDTVELTRRAVKHGCAGVLMLPPFYYKGVSDDGLYAYFSDVIERVSDANLRVYLYHIPPVSQTPLSLALIERLLKAYPTIIAGVKDSGGHWENTAAMINAFGNDGFDVFAGSEAFLLQTMRAGGQGCISATANVNPAAIAHLYQSWTAADADQQQAALTATREIFQSYPMIPALKAAVAQHSGIKGWANVRPPMVALDANQRDHLAADLKAAGFTMPGLKELADA
ncbi:dihydrodipicolinate synthase family protein [Loktanella salsilacus]|uniref:dihydrodipicolinate synthase family protein n=1 Tax=Loktanella salsilacus TaxID=195913 RepID=UPI0020B88ADF|nr:dihydrodipicolinate synthase family protein [Loktanella salsilacus]UTH46343.1 dihydrodipicolinate synthase family protein [Loktanella salsilacus]